LFLIFKDLKEQWAQRAQAQLARLVLQVHLALQLAQQVRKV
jgi:hypothetical protein